MSFRHNPNAQYGIVDSSNPKILPCRMIRKLPFSFYNRFLSLIIVCPQPLLDIYIEIIRSMITHCYQGIFLSSQYDASRTKNDAFCQRRLTAEKMKCFPLILLVTILLRHRLLQILPSQRVDEFPM